MGATIWMICKYAAPAHAVKVGARSFLLLREFARLGHLPVLIASDSNHVANPPILEESLLDEKVDGVLVRWLRTFKYDNPSSYRRVLSWLDFEWRLWRMPHNNLPRPDVVVVSSLSLFSILNGLRLRRRYGCKLVFEVRDIWPLLLYAAGKISPYHPFCLVLGQLERLGYRRADFIVSTLPNLGEHVEECIGQRRPVLCIPQGLEETHLAEPRPLPSGYAETFILKDKFVVCHAGSIGADNALETLFACARAMQARSDVHFLIVGEGYLKTHFQSVCADLKNVTFAPRVEKAAVQSVLAKVDLVYFAVHRSPALRFGQSLNKLIDYMAAAKPVLASYTGFPSMINEADCGVFVPVEDVEALQAAIERFSNMNSEELARVGARGRQWLLENRTYDRLARNYLDFIGVG